MLFLNIQIWACDICGCASGNLFLGIMPQFQKNFIGVRYQYKSFQTEHLPDLFGNKPASSYEQFHQADIWGRVYVHKKIQLFYFVPYLVKRKFENGEITQSSGLGDITLLSNYLIFNTGDSLNRKFRHTLSLGGGMKLPTGQFKLKREGAQIAPAMQPGSGSFDFIFNSIYTIRIKRLGLNTEMNYKFNTSNSQGMKFGNRLMASFSSFYLLQAGKFAFVPQLGLQYEIRSKDSINGELQSPGGGQILNNLLSLDVFFKRISFQISSRIPIYQNLSKNLIQTHPDIMVGININF